MARRSLFNEKRVIKYNYVLALTGNVKLAREARSWSASRIKSKYDLDVNFDDRFAKAVAKKVPKTDLAKKRRFNEYKRGRKLLITVKPIKRSFAKMRPVKSGGIKYDKVEFVPIPIPTDSDIKKAKRETPLSKAVREGNEKYNFNERTENKESKRENWVTWTKSKLFPGDVMEVVEYANKINNKTIDDSYGYAIAHLMYLENISFEDANKIIKPSRFEVDVYTREGKL